MVSATGRHDQRRRCSRASRPTATSGWRRCSRSCRKTRPTRPGRLRAVPPADGPYGLSLQAPKADFAKMQAEWLKTLEQYIADYPAAPDAAEAMLQLGIAREFAGQEDDAKKWYGRIVQEFPDSPAAKKAAGAATRLDRVGKPIALRARASTAARSTWPSYRGKVVLIQYWATWCGPCKADMAALKELAAKYGPIVHGPRRQPRHQREGPERLSGREPAALAADLRGGRPGQPAGQHVGHPHRADDDPGRSAGQSGQPQHRHGRRRGGGEEAAPIASISAYARPTARHR